MFESILETGRIYVIKGSRPVLVKVMLFHSRGCGHPQDDAMANFFLDSKGSISKLSNEVSLFLKSIGKVVKIGQTFCLNLAVRRYTAMPVRNGTLYLCIIWNQFLH